jgi:hypothetical protein
LDKRYQVFVSSTFRDLIDERQAVLRAVLELDHMPAGMELFPAADESAWQLIKDVIDASDYYVLIIGGRYGSTDEAGIGYTEKEYDYAISTKKSVVPLLYEKPETLRRDKTETDEAAWKKLEAFRKKVEKRHTCVYWNSADDLKAKVILGLTTATKRHPAVGWIRADQMPTGATITELLRLKTRVSELEDQLSRERSAPPPGTEDLQRGDDPLPLEVKFTARPHSSTYPHKSDTRYQANIYPSWNEMFAAIAPMMINEVSEPELRSALKEFFSERVKAEFADTRQFKDHTIISAKAKEADIDTCIVQLRALGLIGASVKQRSVRDTRTFWTLTPYGDKLMVQLRALRRTPPAHEHSGTVSKRASTEEEEEEEAG